MTTPVLKIKVLPVPKIRGKMDVRFPGLVTATSPILLDKTGGNFTFSMDIDALSEMLETIFQPFEGIEQHITAAGPVTIWDNAGIVRVDQTVGAPITLNMPLASAKTCPVKIIDWKGDAGTNPITIALSGSDKYQGNLTSWVLDADGASIALDPITGVGYGI